MGHKIEDYVNTDYLISQWEVYCIKKSSLI